MTHLFHDAAIAFNAEHRRKVFLCRGETERTATDVVGSLLSQSFYILECIGGAADDELFAEDTSRLVNGHVVLAQMHTVGMEFAGQLNTVVEQEYGIVLLA